MDPGKQKGREKKAARDEFVAYYTKKPGRSLQPKRPQRRFADISASTITPASHGEEASPGLDQPLPREDRAG